MAMNLGKKTLTTIYCFLPCSVRRDFSIQIFLYWHFKCSKSVVINPTLPMPLFKNKYFVLFPYYPEIKCMMI